MYTNCHSTVWSEVVEMRLSRFIFPFLLGITIGESADNLTVISNYVDGIKTFGEAEAIVEHYAELSNDPKGNKRFSKDTKKTHKKLIRRSARSLCNL